MHQSEGVALGPTCASGCNDIGPTLANSSQISDNDPYRGPRIYILCTTLLCTLLAGAPYPVSNFASPSIGFVSAHGFVGLPIPDPISVFHATSSPFPRLLPGLRVSVVTVSSSGVASKTPQTMCGVVHLSVSY